MCSKENKRAKGEGVEILILNLELGGFLGNLPNPPKKKIDGTLFKNIL